MIGRFRFRRAQTKSAITTRGYSTVLKKKLLIKIIKSDIGDVKKWMLIKK